MKKALYAFAVVAMMAGVACSQATEEVKQDTAVAVEQTAAPVDTAAVDTAAAPADSAAMK